MILQDIEMNNRIFIDDEIFNQNNDVKFALSEFNNGIYTIIRDDDFLFDVKFVNENMFTIRVARLKYNATNNCLHAYGTSTLLFSKTLKENEMMQITNQGSILIIESCDIPKFIEEECFDNIYPKFEISLSDCIYHVKIYINDHEYIDIPDYQSYDNILDSLNYLTNIVKYFTQTKPDFFEKLCNNNTFILTITTITPNSHSCDTNIMNYKISDEGIYIELPGEHYLVEWHKFFKLIIDEKWDIVFIENFDKK